VHFRIKTFLTAFATSQLQRHGYKKPEKPINESNPTFMISKKMVPGCLVALFLFGCNEIDDLLTFAVNDTTTIRIESSAPLNLPVEIPTPEVTSNSEQQYSNNNTRADLVKDVKLDELKLTITDPTTKTFSFIKSIRIYISSDEVSEIQLASLENISSTQNVLVLMPTAAKLDAYAKAASYTLRTEVTTRETLTEAVDVRVDLRFLVTADTF
jgi:hypothetical protein